MNKRIVAYCRPAENQRKDQEQPGISISQLEIPLETQTTPIYRAVDIFERQFKTNPGIKRSKKKITDKRRLRSIINLHNKEGTRNLSQISSMIVQLASGKDILSRSGLPNIKLVRTREDELLLFDGHHSLLAYIANKKKYLHEIPHIIIENNGKGHASEIEILDFFGRHSSRIYPKCWKEYTINWQAGDQDQLTRRVQRNMGELFDSISNVLEYFINFVPSVYFNGKGKEDS